jgi:hypothetical protein
VRLNIPYVLASIGLAVGSILGIAGTYAPTVGLRGIAWGVDGLALVMAGSILTIEHIRAKRDVLASGFLVFTVGQGLILSTAAAPLSAGVPTFGAGVGLWSVALLMISIPTIFPAVVRLLGISSALLFGITATRIFSGESLVATSAPLPSFAYPVLVATMLGWIWSFWRKGNLSTGR